MQLINRIRIKNIILSIVTTIIAIIVPAFILNKYIEGVLFFIGHWLIRKQYPKQYSFSTHYLCRLVTGVVFFLSVSFILPLCFSLFFTIPLNYFISWISYNKKQADYFEVECEQLRDKISRICPTLKPLNINNCTEDELVKRCKLLKMTKHATEMSINIFVKKMTIEELSKTYFINKRSVIIHKARLKKRLQL